MKLIPFFFKPTKPTLSSPSWPWPYCGNSKTLSFRAETITNSLYMAVESSFINSSVCESTDNELSFCTIELEENEYSDQGSDQSTENVIRGLRSSSGRLFFDNHIGEATNCILGDQDKLAKTNNITKIYENDCATSNSSYICSSDNKVVLMEMDSRDPFEDFKKSMEEMVEASDFNTNDNWDSLHQLLSWYLHVNCEGNHGYIVGAFIDLLVSFEFSSASNSSFSSPTSSSSGASRENDHNSSSASATVITESPISDSSFSSKSSTDPCLSTLQEEEVGEDAGLDHCFPPYQEENNISKTN